MKICIVSKIDSKEPLELAQSLGWALSDLGCTVVTRNLWLLNLDMRVSR